MRYQCPICDQSEELYVVVSTWAKLNQDEGDDTFETDLDDDGCPDHDHDFDDTSTMHCGNCHHYAPVADFSFED